MLNLLPLVALSMVALLIGAVLGLLLRNRAWGVAALKGLMASFIGGFMVFHLLPSAYAKLGPYSLLFVLAGFMVMVLPEKLLARHGHGHESETGRVWTAEILWIGLVLHEVSDGIGLVLASSDYSNDWYLALTVLAHRVPVAAVIFWLFQRRGNLRGAWIRLAGMGLATLAGVLFSRSLTPLLDSRAIDVFYAFIAGSFLHLVAHDFLDHHAHNPRDRRFEFGAFFTGVFLFLLADGRIPGLASDTLREGVSATHNHVGNDTFFSVLLMLIQETAPYLLLGLVVSGLLQAFMPRAPLAWLRRGGPLLQSAKGMAFGLPLPICSCGVLPMFVSLARKGVPTAALISFLIATPAVGVDSFLLSVKMLGWEFSIVRLIVAIILPFAIALIAVRFLSPVSVLAEGPGSCCAGHHDEPGESKDRWWRFAFVDLVDDIFPFVLFGLVVAALAQTIWPVSDINHLAGTWDILLMAALGIPFYVCASASVPMAMVLLHHGFSAGAVVVFLFAGPATNVATILTTNKVFGPRSGLKLAIIALVLAVAMGFAINAIYLPQSIDLLATAHGTHWSWLDYFCTGALLVLALASLYRAGPLHWLSNVAAMIPGAVQHPPVSKPPPSPASPGNDS